MSKINITSVYALVIRSAGEMMLACNGDAGRMWMALRLQLFLSHINAKGTPTEDQAWANNSRRQGDGMHATEADCVVSLLTVYFKPDDQPGPVDISYAEAYRVLADKLVELKPEISDGHL